VARGASYLAHILFTMASIVVTMFYSRAITKPLVQLTEAASRTICRVFQHSPVFRIGGDEFAIILQNEDYENRDALVNRFLHDSAEINAAAANKWEQVQVALGIAAYDPQEDRSVNDVTRRADKAMYEDKRLRKSGASPVRQVIQSAKVRRLIRAAFQPHPLFIRKKPRFCSLL